MGDRIFVQGNEAIGWGALMAGCDCYFGYPITPQSETLEWFAREFPKRGKTFVQSQSEVASPYLVLGAAASGARAMTSTASAGWSLMQDGMSAMANAEIPCVVVLVQRGGPGMGHVRVAQQDYRHVTSGGGHGGYRNLVLAPYSPQENHDLVQLAFSLADKYCNPVIVLSDALMGQLGEPVDVHAIDFGPAVAKPWAMVGKAARPDGKRLTMSCAKGNQNPDFLEFQGILEKKFDAMKSEVRYEKYLADDADLIIVAFGYTARVSEAAIDMARERGIKVGLIRPITLWPFPTQVLRDKAKTVKKFLVVEDNLGQMVETVEQAVGEGVEMSLVNTFARHEGGDGGKIFPDKVLFAIETAAKGSWEGELPRWLRLRSRKSLAGRS